MGYHSSSRSKSEVVYGRDNVAPALRVLDAIVESVSVGKFVPDATHAVRNVSEQCAAGQATGSRG